MGSMDTPYQPGTSPGLLPGCNPWILSPLKVGIPMNKVTPLVLQTLEVWRARFFPAKRVGELMLCL